MQIPLFLECRNRFGQRVLRLSANVSFFIYKLEGMKKVECDSSAGANSFFAHPVKEQRVACVIVNVEKFVYR